MVTDVGRPAHRPGAESRAAIGLGRVAQAGIGDNRRRDHDIRAQFWCTAARQRCAIRAGVYRRIQIKSDRVVRMTKGLATAFGPTSGDTSLLGPRIAAATARHCLALAMLALLLAGCATRPINPKLE